MPPSNGKTRVSSRGRCHGVIVVLALLSLAAAKQDEQESDPDLTSDAWLGQTYVERSKLVDYFKKCSDEELQTAFDQIFKEPGFRSKAGYNPCLWEMVRRGRMQWETFLQERFDQLMAKEIKPYENADDLVPGEQFNLELLTALRRLQKQPDPLQISVTNSENLTGTSVDLPVLEVTIKNVDKESVNIGFTFGGNYRSGRQTRWKILVQDGEGNEIPARGSLSPIGGGIFTTGVLEPGESWETSLSVRSYIEIPPPGKYTLTVLYHDTQTIASDTSVDGLIVCRSEPLPFAVKPLTIVSDMETQETVQKLVDELPGDERVKIVAGTYGDWAHDFIAPDSPAGKLLSMGLKATPTIINSLEDEHLTMRKRAWLFAILYSLTGENDPRQNSRLGSYEYKEGAWQIWGGRSGEAPSGGMSLGGGGSYSGKEIEPEA